MIDLHSHSTASDGSFSPEEIAELGRTFALMALTDHDTCEGARRFLSASGRIGAAGVRWAGVELSVAPDPGYRKFHMLGLGVDPDSPRLNALLDAVVAGRDERNLVILERLRALGAPIELQDAERFADGRVVARPHFARALVARGYATSISDAFARFIGNDAPAYAQRYRPSPEQAIEAVHAAGGLAVLAHPRYWTCDPAALRSGLRKLKDFGLDGVEAIYQSNAPGETVDHLMAAKELGLLVTAGSDFHGTNKPGLHLGMEPHDEAALVAALLSAHDRHASPSDMV